MKKVLTIIVFFACVVFNVVAQRHELDSLNTILRASPENKKIEIYQEIVIRLWLNHPDSALYYVDEAMQLAKKLNDVKAKAIATRLLGGAHYYKGTYDSTIKYSFQSYRYSEQINDSTLMTSAMNNIGLAYYNISSYPEALEYLLRSLNLKTRIKQEYGYSQTLNNVGLVYTELRDYEKARIYFRKANDLSRKTNDKN